MKAQLKKNAVVCESIRVVASDADSLLMYCNNGSQWYQEGIVVVSPFVVMEVNVGGMIEGDVSKRELLVVNGEDVSEIEHNQVLDLNDDESDGKAMFFIMNLVVGACCLTQMERRCMRDSEWVT